MNKDEACEILSKLKSTVCFGCMHPQQFGWCEETCRIPEAISFAMEHLSNGKEERMAIKEIYRCIVCGEEMSHPRQVVCDGCREAILHYKEVYAKSKKIMETTDLDEQIFKTIYDCAGLDRIIEADFDEDDIEYILNDVRKYAETMPQLAWLNQQEGRLDQFLDYIRQKALAKISHQEDQK